MEKCFVFVSGQLSEVSSILHCDWGHHLDYLLASSRDSHQRAAVYHPAVRSGANTLCCCLKGVLDMGIMLDNKFVTPDPVNHSRIKEIKHNSSTMVTADSKGEYY